jgi:hypothetical protein
MNNNISCRNFVLLVIFTQLKTIFKFKPNLQIKNKYINNKPHNTQTQMDILNSLAKEKANTVSSMFTLSIPAPQYGL